MDSGGLIENLWHGGVLAKPSPLRTGDTEFLVLPEAAGDEVLGPWRDPRVRREVEAAARALLSAIRWLLLPPRGVGPWARLGQAGQWVTSGVGAGLANSRGGVTCFPIYVKRGAVKRLTGQGTTSKGEFGQTRCGGGELGGINDIPRTYAPT